jgi:hypothetical protein
MEPEGSKASREERGMIRAEPVERLEVEGMRLEARGMRSEGELALFEN